MFDWKYEKVALRTLLDTCIRNDCTYEETKQALEAQFSASCTVCCIANLGCTICDSGRKCFVEEALDRYLNIAAHKCRKEA